MQLMQYRAVKYPRAPRVKGSKQHLLVYRGVEYTSRLSEMSGETSDVQNLHQFTPLSNQSLAA